MTIEHNIALIEDIDGPKYLKTMIALCTADGEVHEKEREFIEMQAQLLSLDPAEYWANPESDLTFLQHVEMSRITYMTIIRDCIVLGHIDGEYDHAEKEHVVKIASMLGLTASDVDAVEGWLRELWAVLEKGNTLFQGE